MKRKEIRIKKNIIMEPHGLSFERPCGQYRKWSFSHFMMRGHPALQFSK
jgi:hypothetical protein